MALTPKKFREIVFQTLFSYDFFLCEEMEIVPILMEKLKISRKYVKEAFKRMKEIHSKKSSIDRKIKKFASGYRLERISKSELNILRLGIYELLFDDEIPDMVAISEAVRLCNKFSTPSGARFVNAILDGIYKEQKKPKN